MPLGAWGARWREVLPEHHDPYLALWMVSRLIDPATLPQPRVVVRFDVTGGRRPDRYWLVLGRTDSEVCVTEPGYPTDGVVGTDAGHAGPLGHRRRDARRGAAGRHDDCRRRRAGWTASWPPGAG